MTVAVVAGEKCPISYADLFGTTLGHGEKRYTTAEGLAVAARAVFALPWGWRGPRPVAGNDNGLGK